MILMIGIENPYTRRLKGMCGGDTERVCDAAQNEKDRIIADAVRHVLDCIDWEILKRFF